MIKISISKFFNNRFNILYIVIILIISILTFKLATLTIVEGEKYRETSDIKRIKDIPTKAPRGKIYDRNGVILADNLTSFTVQIYKNKIKRKDVDETLYTLTNILSDNCENLIDDFPIILDTYGFKDDTSSSFSAVYERVLNILKEKNLINEWIRKDIKIYDENYSITKNVYAVLNKEFKNLPITLSNKEFVYTEQESEFFEENSIPKDMSANDLVVYLLKNNDRILLNLLSDSRVRKFTYEFLSEKNLIENIELVPYAYLKDQEYKSIKNSLILTYEGITETTSAKDDFVYLTEYYIFDKLFNSVYDNKKDKIIPGKILLDAIKEKFEDFPVDIIVNENTIEYSYIDGMDKQKYIGILNSGNDISAYDMLKNLALFEKNILRKVIIEKVSYYAQSELLERGINPSISISAWEYTPLYEKNSWIEKNASDIDDKSAENVFKSLKSKIKVDFEINDYEARNILVVKERYNGQGYLSYHPIDISYNLSEKTVAMLSERNHELNGVNVEIEPIRYYPGKNLAAHILGYMGKISQESEISKYLSDEKLGYSYNDIIGKTGVEEKFELYLSGQKGKKSVAVNVNGNTIESVDEKYPIPGDNLYLTIDSRLQAKAEEVLEKGLQALQKGGTYESEWGNFKFGSAYKNATSACLNVIDVKTGELLALANYPSYDLNMFASGITSENWNSLLNDSKDPLAPRPLYNISLLTAIQPGSTFKMVTALAALEKGVNPNSKVYCAGSLNLGDRKFGCWIYNMHGGHHGQQNIYEAIKNSCNFYFFVTMLGYNPVTGDKHDISLSFEDVTNMAENLGLNDPTGIEIDIPKEFSGGVPDIENKKITSKFYLKLFLDKNLKYYIKDGYNMSDEELEKAIDSIVGLIKDDIPTRTEVYNKLIELNIDPDKTHESNIPIVDIIKYTYLNHSVWSPGDSLNLSIGQGENAYTPLQMANYVATIANGGYKHNVSVIDRLETYDGKEITYEGERKSERIELKNYDNLEILKQGMKLVSLDTNVFRTFPVGVGVKTGTAQKDGLNPETKLPYDDFAWYVAFAPYDDPKIAVSCVIFQGGSGVYPAPLVRDIIAEYLVLNNMLERPQQNKE